MNSSLNLLVFIWSIIIGGLYIVGRLNSLSILRHRLPVVLFHWAMAVLAFSATLHSWKGDFGMMDLAALVASSTWLINSWKSWGLSNTPEHTRRPHA